MKRIVFALFFVLISLDCFAVSRDSLDNELKSDLKSESIRESKTEEVIVSGSRIKKLYKDSGRDIIVIDSMQIRNSSANSVGDLLDMFSVVDVRQRGGDGVQSDVSIRAGSFDQVAILINGVRVNDMQTGHHNMNLPIDLSAVDRIEILKGSGARVLGPSAYSGAINIITKNEIDRSLMLDLEYGSYDFQKVNSMVNYNNSSWSNLLSLNYKKSDGYIRNTDFEYWNVVFSSNYSGELFEISGLLGYSQWSFGAYNYYTPKYPNQYEETETIFGNVNFSFHGEDYLIESKSLFRRNKDKFELFRSGRTFEDSVAPSWYVSPNFHSTDNLIQTFNFSYFSFLGESNIGLDYEYSKIISNVLGDKELGGKKSGYSEPFYTKWDERRNSNIYFEHNYKYEKLNLSGGFLYNISDGFKNDIFPGIDLAYNTLGNDRLTLSVNKSMRLPTFTDLYYSGPENVGNLDLEPETNLSVELGYLFEIYDIGLSLSVYGSTSENSIAWVKFNYDDKYQTSNLTEVNIFGGEINAVLMKEENKGEFIQNLNLGLVLNSQDVSSDKIETKYANDYNKIKATINFSHSTFYDVMFNWSFRYLNRAGGYFKWEAEMGEFEKELSDMPSYFLGDLKLVRDWESFRVYISINNLFDSSYFDVAEIPQPGRWLKLGIKTNLKY